MNKLNKTKIITVAFLIMLICGLVCAYYLLTKPIPKVEATPPKENPTITTPPSNIENVVYRTDDRLANKTTEGLNFVQSLGGGANDQNCKTYILPDENKGKALYLIGNTSSNSNDFNATQSTVYIAKSTLDGTIFKSMAHKSSLTCAYIDSCVTSKGILILVKTNKGLELLNYNLQLNLINFTEFNNCFSGKIFYDTAQEKVFIATINVKTVQFASYDSNIKIKEFSKNIEFDKTPEIKNFTNLGSNNTVAFIDFNDSYCKIVLKNNLEILNNENFSTKLNSVKISNNFYFVVTEKSNKTVLDKYLFNHNLVNTYKQDVVLENFFILKDYAVTLNSRENKNFNTYICSCGYFYPNNSFDFLYDYNILHTYLQDENFFVLATKNDNLFLIKINNNTSLTKKIATINTTAQNSAEILYYNDSYYIVFNNTIFNEIASFGGSDTFIVNVNF
ncbi:MAG: hypothetical protein RR374_05360 [Clostridia bacterium]